MHSTLLSILVCGALLVGCGINPTAGAPPAQAMTTLPPATATARALQKQVNAASFEATIVMATIGVLQAGAPASPAVATEAFRRYQDNVATWEVLAPAAQTMEPPVFPATVQPTDPVEATRLAEANAAAAGLPVTPTLWNPSAHPLETPVPAGLLPPTMSPRPTPNVLDLSRFPARPAPGALAGRRLPATSDDVATLIESLPRSMAGLGRVGKWEDGDKTTFTVAYGREAPDGATVSQVVLNVQDVAAVGGSPSGFSAAHAVQAMTTALQDELGRGRDGRVYWVLHRQPTGRTEQPEVYLLHIGAADGMLMLSLQASSLEELNLVIEAVALQLAEAAPEGSP